MQLHYKEIGSGYPLIILHGLFGMSDNFVSIASELGRNYRVFIVDQRNHGRSGHSQIFNYEAMSDDLMEFMNDHQLESAHLLGHSMGGKTAMQFAFDQPERVGKLIIADISPAARKSSDQHKSLITIMQHLNLSSFEKRVEVANALESQIPSFRLRQFLLKNIFWKDKTSLGWRINLEVLNENLHEVFREVKPSAPYHKPTLFMRGELSDYIQHKDMDLIRSIFSNVQFVTIKGGTHWLHADNPDDFVLAVKNFLG